MCVCVCCARCVCFAHIRRAYQCIVMCACACGWSHPVGPLLMPCLGSCFFAYPCPSPVSFSFFVSGPFLPSLAVRPYVNICLLGSRLLLPFRHGYLMGSYSGYYICLCLVCDYCTIRVRFDVPFGLFGLVVCFCLFFSVLFALCPSSVRLFFSLSSPFFHFILLRFFSFVLPPPSSFLLPLHVYSCFFLFLPFIHRFSSSFSSS